MTEQTKELLDYGMSDEELFSHATVFRDDLLKDKVFVISGGGSGMGRAIAVLFSRLGAKVMICGRREEKLRSVQEAIKTNLNVDIAVQPMTIREPEQVEQLMQRCWDEFGQLDALINSAGGQFTQAAIDFSVKGWQAVIDTNLNGTWYMMQAAAKLWQKHNTPGSIVTIVANVQRGMPQVAHTCAARAGVVYLSKTLSVEWAPLNIRVNCVSPGAIETEGFNMHTPEVVETLKNTNPMYRCGHVYDIAEAVVYLSADSGNFVTGEVLTVDGGNQQFGQNWPGGIPDYFKQD